MHSLTRGFRSDLEKSLEIIGGVTILYDFPVFTVSVVVTYSICIVSEVWRAQGIIYDLFMIYDIYSQGVFTP